MPYLNTAERRPGRPRDDDLEARILVEVVALLGERGYGGVTFEAVARRAGASKATLYRRWPTKRAMVLAAVQAGPARRAAGTPIDTGTLRGDLLALAQRLLTTMRDTDARVSLLLLQAGLDDPALCEAIETTLGPTGGRLPADVLERAVRRGELPEGADPFAYDEVVGAALLLRRLNGLHVDDAHVEALVDHVLLPALRAPVERPLPPGIFSGRPEHDIPTEETP